ncbi:lipoprotein [Spirochaetia bacterium]|nr:lipoprotein [Spirochaetia bacterium]
MISADLIVKNAVIHTLDDKKPQASALAVRNGEFLAVGDLADCETFRGPHTKIVDAEGRALLPGFNDAHCHLLSLRGQQLLALDCSSSNVHCVDDILRLVAKAAETTPEGEWVLGAGYDPTKLAEKRPPTRQELDQATSRHPVHIRAQSCHTGVVNSAGFAKAGIGRDTPNPKGGEFDRDSNGDLTGLCKEEAHFLFVSGMGGETSYVPPYTPEQYDRALVLASAEYNALGITSVGDALSGPPEIRAYSRAYNAGTLTVRAYLNLLDVNLPALRALGLSTGYGNDWVKIGALKSFADGAIAGHTAWLSEPYLGTNYTGIPTKTPEEMNTLALDACGAGFQVEIHANGDRAISMVLDAYEKAQSANGVGRSYRNRIAHCTLINDEILDRIKKLGVVVCPFSTYVWEHGDKMAPYGDRIERMFAHRSFLDRGIPVGGSSDHPCGTHNPFKALEAMVTRKGSDGKPVGLSQRISLEEALNIYTRGSAYTSFEEHRKGMIREGMLADFVITSSDPFKIESSALHEIKVIKTFTGGKAVFEA